MSHSGEDEAIAECLGVSNREVAGLIANDMSYDTKRINENTAVAVKSIAKSWRAARPDVAVPPKSCRGCCSRNCPVNETRYWFYSRSGNDLRGCCHNRNCEVATCKFARLDEAYQRAEQEEAASAARLEALTSLKTHSRRTITPQYTFNGSRRSTSSPRSSSPRSASPVVAPSTNNTRSVSIATQIGNYFKNTYGISSGTRPKETPQSDDNHAPSASPSSTLSYYSQTSLWLINTLLSGTSTEDLNDDDVYTVHVTGNDEEEERRIASRRSNKSKPSKPAADKKSKPN